MADTFERFCRGEVEPSQIFWRAINIELWLRVFFDAPVVVHDADLEAALTRPHPVGPERRGPMPEAGDRLVPGLVEAGGNGDGPALRATAERLLDDYHPNEMKHLFAAVAGDVYARLPVKTDLVGRGDDLDDLFRRQVLPHVRPGDVVAVAGSPSPQARGAGVPIDEIVASPLARVLSKAVTRSPHGIGLGTPRPCSSPSTRPRGASHHRRRSHCRGRPLVGQRGWFYRIAGPTVEAIDGPTPYTLPPHNTHAKLGPADPDGVAQRLADLVTREMRTGGVQGNGRPVDVGVAVVARQRSGRARPGRFGRRRPRPRASAHAR